ADYINCPMEKDEYLAFYDELVKAEVSNLHEFEKREIFESCMPIEIMAKRGADTLRYGPLKPVGLTDPHTGRRPYAVVQLRQDDMSATMHNLVGFQTNLRWGEQKRVFSMIPGLQNAEFVKYGVMHRNTYVNAPTCLNSDFSLKRDDHIYIAGQLSGVEGYVESAMSGLVSAISIRLRNEGKQLNLPNTSIIGALTRYISYENEDFQPMNANFGILPELEEHIRDKSARKLAYSARAIRDMLEVVSYMED
ncbi:MAG: methylenetetrahydrofolate--tRNA-(uracil(54)-C(5))-methyltransferase (FADH(2)-oxidizing) TrmFO, partial [Clostridia bacterium]|nr:methylenetetrahydrofolate--tRNA-(uracil(54)-C(5))-methyltransferase (FADH(2)-oxidizing) TrmFO [Clostridia bacterium]